MLIIDCSISKTNVTKLDSFVCQWWQEYIWLQPIISPRLRNVIPRKSCLLFVLLTLFFLHHLQWNNKGSKYMQWIALDEDVAMLIVSLVITLDSIKGTELSRQGDIRAPTSSADFEEETQAGRNSCRGAQKQHLLLFYLICPCNVVMSRVAVCFAEEWRNSGVSKCNFLTSLGNARMQVQIIPFTVRGFS